MRGTATRIAAAPRTPDPQATRWYRVAQGLRVQGVAREPRAALQARVIRVQHVAPEA